MTSVGRAGVGRCLDRYARQIEYDFDDACESSRAGMNALRGILKHYIWGCI